MTIPIFTGVLGAIYESMNLVTAADKAYRLLKDAGLEITRNMVREGWKTVGERTSWGRVVEKWGTDRLIPKAWVMEGPRGMTTEYQYRYGLIVWNPDTKKFEERVATVMSDEWSAPSRYEEQISERLTESATWQGMEIVGTFFAGIYRRGR